MRRILQLLALAAVTTLATHLVVTRTVGHAQAVIWLPSGIAMAGVWLLGWPAAITIALTTLANRLGMGYTADAAIGAGLGSMLEALLGCWLLHRLGLREGCARLRDAIALLTAATIAPIGSIICSWVGRFVLGNWQVQGPFYSGWHSWWGMNALGILLIMPVVLTRHAPATAPRGKNARATLLALVSAAAALLWAVTTFAPPSPTAIVLLFTLLPIPLFGALRLGPRGAIVPAAASALLLALITAGEQGPFMCVPIADRYAPLQIFLVVILAVPMVIGSLIAEREASEAAGRQLEDQLRQAQKMDAIGKLAGGVAHDFNNLLMATIGYAEALREQLPRDDKRRADVDGILQACDRAAGLVQQLLAFSRKQALKPEIVDLGLVVETMAPMLRRLLGERIRLDTSSVDGPNCVRVDRVQMEQVLLNLVVNARDAMPDGGTVKIATSHTMIPVGGRKDVPALAAGEHVVLQVRDNGEGMNAEVHAHAFDPFYTTKEPHKGTGLGLSTVYGIVEQSGGHLHIDSAPGQGTTVWMHLPRVAGAPAPAITPAPPRAAVPSATVLLVEDEGMVRDLIARLLQRAGYTVLTAEGGAQALELAERHLSSLQLLVTDMVMPDIGGRELAQRLHARRPDLPTLFMSGYAQDIQDIVDDAHRGDRAFLQKPFLSEQLLNTVAALLTAAPATPATSTAR